MANLTLLHLSDIHLGASGQEAAQERIAQKGIEKTLAQHIRRDGHRKPDLCIFSGDLAHSGRLDQFQKGEAWLKKITYLNLVLFSLFCFLQFNGFVDTKYLLVCLPGRFPSSELLQGVPPLLCTLARAGRGLPGFINFTSSKSWHAIPRSMISSVLLFYRLGVWCGTVHNHERFA